MSKSSKHTTAHNALRSLAAPRKGAAGAQVGFSSPAATAREEYMSVPLHGPFGNTDAAETLELNDEQKLAAKGALLRSLHRVDCATASESSSSIQ